MNKRIEELALKADMHRDKYGMYFAGDKHDEDGVDLEQFAHLLIEAVLDEVKDRAYVTGDRDWSDGVDRPWIQLEFGYGELHEQSKR
jgi:hypothetical protein